MKEIEKQQISELQMMEEIKKHKDKILEAFAKAYLAETNIPPSELEFVQQQVNSESTHIIEYRMFFRRKTDGSTT